MTNSNEQGQFDPEKLAELPDENVTLSAGEVKHALEKQLAGMLEEIASYDEKIAQLESVKARYQRIIETSPQNENAAQEVRDLQGDIDLLIEGRDHYVIQRQTIREQIKEQSKARAADDSQRNSGHTDPLLLRIEAIRKRVASRAPTPDLFSNIQPELDYLENARKEVAKVEEDKSEKRERSKLLPALYTNQDFFVADILGYSLKDDHVTSCGFLAQNSERPYPLGVDE